MERSGHVLKEATSWRTRGQPRQPVTTAVSREIFEISTAHIQVCSVTATSPSYLRLSEIKL